MVKKPHYSRVYRTPQVFPAGMAAVKKISIDTCLHSVLCIGHTVITCAPLLHTYTHFEVKAMRAQEGGSRRGDRIMSV